MSDADLHALSDALGIEPGKLETVLTLMRRAVREELEATVRTAEAPAPPLPSRKYTLDEVRLRLVTGRDPASFSDAERDRAEGEAVSLRTVQRLISRRQLEKVVVSGTPYVTETQVRTYERKLAEGRIRQPAARRGRRPTQTP